MRGFPPITKKLTLKHEVHVLKSNIKNQDKDVKELKVEGSHQSDHYDELWRAHEVLLEVTQKLRS